MDALVQFLRNALCCIKDLKLFSSSVLWDSSYTATYYRFPEPLNKTTPLEVIISMTQFYAFLSATKSGWTTLVTSYGKWKRIERLMDVRQQQQQQQEETNADRLVNASLIKEAMYALRSMFIGLNVLFIGLSFFWLFANSWHVTETNWIGGVQGLVHALTVMEVCLLPLLYYMYQDGNEQLVKAQRMEQLASKLMSKTGQLSADDVNLSSLEVMEHWLPFWDSGVGLFEPIDTSKEAKMMQAETAKAARLLQDLVDNNNNNNKEKEEDEKEEANKIRRAELEIKAQELQGKAQLTRLEGYREYLYFFMNLVAFYGYLLNIVVYYYNDEHKQPSWVRNYVLMGMNNTDADWNGNFAGDVMWTVEPIVILTSPVILSSLTTTTTTTVPKKEKAKVD